VAEAENVHLFEKQMDRVLQKIPLVEFEREEHRGPLRRRRRGVFPLYKTVDIFKHVRDVGGVHFAGTSFGLLGRIQGRKHLARGHVERVRFEQRERLDRMLQCHIRERHQSGRAPDNHTLRHGHHPGNGFGGDYPHVLQLLSEQALPSRPAVHVPRAVGVRGVHHQLFRVVFVGHREEVDRRVPAANGGNASAILSVLQQRVHRLGLLHKQQDVVPAEAEGDIQRAALVSGRRPTQVREQEPRPARERGHRPAADLGAGAGAHRFCVLLRLPDFLLLDQAAAAGTDVRVGVPVGVHHPGGHNVLQHRVADHLRRAAEVREPAYVPGGPAVHTADHMRQAVAAGRAAGLGVQADQLRAREVAVRQRAVRLAAVLGDVRGQDHVQAADRGRGQQDRYHRADQLSPQPVDPALQEQPVPGHVQAGAEPGQARAGRDLRADDRMAGRILHYAAAGPGPGLAGHHVLHQAVLVHRQLQPRPAGVQPVSHPHHDHVHVVGRLSVVRRHVAGRCVPHNAVPVLRPVQGVAVRVAGARRLGALRRADLGGRRPRDTDRRKFRVPVGVRPVVRHLLLSYRDGFKQEDDRRAAEAARPRGPRQTVPVEQAERVHQTTGQTPQGCREPWRDRRAPVLISRPRTVPTDWTLALLIDLYRRPREKEFVSRMRLTLLNVSRSYFPYSNIPRGSVLPRLYRS